MISGVKYGVPVTKKPNKLRGTSWRQLHQMRVRQWNLKNNCKHRMFSGSMTYYASAV